MRNGRLVSWASLISLAVLAAIFAAWSTSASVTGLAVPTGRVHGASPSPVSASRSQTTTFSSHIPYELQPPPAPTQPPGTTPVLGSNGLGVVYFGATEDETVAALSAYFGSSTGRPQSGCDQQWTEIAWNDLVVEFLDKIFIGYRYLSGGWESTAATTAAPSVLRPSLETVAGIGLASTLGQLETTYPDLQQTGSFQWTSPDGIHFVVNSDQTSSYPPPSNTAMAEIKIGTCGDF